MYRFLAIVLVLTLLSFRCRQDNTCANRSYVFGVTGAYSARATELQLGDSLFFTAVFPKLLYDSVSASSIDYSGSRGISGDFSLYRVDTVLRRYRTDGFGVRFVPLDAVFGRSSGTTQSVTAREGAQEYRLRIGILVSEPGIYAVSANGFHSAGLEGQDCGAAGFSLRVPPTAAALALFRQALGRDPYPGEYLPYLFRVR